MTTARRDETRWTQPDTINLGLYEATSLGLAHHDVQPPLKGHSPCLVARE